METSLNHYKNLNEYILTKYFCLEYLKVHKIISNQNVHLNYLNLFKKSYI